jgi:hypothetical protein
MQYATRKRKSIFQAQKLVDPRNMLDGIIPGGNRVLPVVFKKWSKQNLAICQKLYLLKIISTWGKVALESRRGQDYNTICK